MSSQDALQCYMREMEYEMILLYLIYSGRLHVSFKAFHFMSLECKALRLLEDHQLNTADHRIDANRFSTRVFYSCKPFGAIILSLISLYLFKSSVVILCIYI